jgi:Ca-activated chloride channel homolog
MSYLRPFRLSIILVLSCTGFAQVLSMPTMPGGKFGGSMGIDPLEAGRMSFDIFTINSQNGNRTPLQSPGGSVSKFDLKAPGKAKKEYEKGYQLLQRKDLQGAVEHLSNAVRIYADFVSAHNALGTAYLDLNQNQSARSEFAKAVAIDDHMPNSFLNLGIAELALNEFPAAEESLRKASSIAPLDLQLSVALSYGEFANKDYAAVMATAKDVHARKHKGAETVHYYAAAALSAQNKLVEAQGELETLLKEDPQSASAGQYRKLLADITTEQRRQIDAKLHPAPTSIKPTQQIVVKKDEAEEAQQAAQDEAEQKQIAEAETADAASGNKASENGSIAELPNTSDVKRAARTGSGFVFRSSVDEVDVFFSATDKGRSVTGLTPADIKVLDNNRVPDRIIGFRNESQLPLRLGLVIDTSDSVRGRLSFEQKAAIKFLQSVLRDRRDLAFVVGVNNSVLMVQDFSSNQAVVSHAVNQLAPGGGTALWDAVAFASEKLGKVSETQPVARVLVVVSDGEDNSSNAALKEAIASGVRNEIVVYTVSTRELTDDSPSALIGDHALKTLSEQTGGAAFVPGSLHRLGGSLADVQQVIRGRYLLTYKPANFERDGHYRSISVAAERDGRRFRVFARKGYYASEAPSDSEDQQ